MDTRLILQIALGVIIVLIVVVGGITIFALTRDAETVIMQELAEESTSARERRNPWADQGDVAIAMVSRLSVSGDPGVEIDGNVNVGALLENEQFVAERLKITTGEPQGWSAEWWGETRFGPTFYLVRYGFLDENVIIGPTWLVNLERNSQRAVPKNVLAEVATNPSRGMRSDYYDQARQVVAAMTNHTFPSRINLGGALLRYFDGREAEGDDDRVVGWTVDHNREELFRAYFQWTEGGTHTYAQFEFDFDQRALRPVNLQAHEIMRIGEEFEPFEKVSIMPRTYDPSVLRPDHRWQGAARRQCTSRQHRNPCRALATILDDGELIETLEWMLTTDENSAAAFEQCQQVQDGQRRPNCQWRPEEQEDGSFRVRYLYKLGDEEEEIAWDVYLSEERVVPVDQVAELAYRAVHARR